MKLLVIRYDGSYETFGASIVNDDEVEQIDKQLRTMAPGWFRWEFIDPFPTSELVQLMIDEVEEEYR